MNDGYKDFLPLLSRIFFYTIIVTGKTDNNHP